MELAWNGLTREATWGIVPFAWTPLPIDMLYSALGNIPPTQWRACALTVLRSDPRIFDEEARLAQMRINLPRLVAPAMGWVRISSISLLLKVRQWVSLRLLGLHRNIRHFPTFEMRPINAAFIQRPGHLNNT